MSYSLNRCYELCPAIVTWTQSSWRSSYRECIFETVYDCTCDATSCFTPRLVATIKQHIAICKIVPPAPPVSKVVGMYSRTHKATSQLWIRGEGGKQKPKNDMLMSLLWGSPFRWTCLNHWRRNQYFGKQQRHFVHVPMCCLIMATNRIKSKTCS